MIFTVTIAPGAYSSGTWHWRAEWHGPHGSGATHSFASTRARAVAAADRRCLDIARRHNSGLDIEYITPQETP
ncbi:hypothetical protein [Streptomyces sp. NPDC015131]|uniref:hypothetical protein n=1 Tax=Streptomyces sp. NPDC015131 TaxID=3364941 RepID=UPI00370066E7